MDMKAKGRWIGLGHTWGDEYNFIKVRKVGDPRIHTLAQANIKNPRK